MLKKDFFLRTINEFLKALQDVISFYKNDNLDASNEILKNSYAFLGNTKLFFEKEDSEVILNFLINQENGIEKIKLLAELFLTHSKITVDQEKNMLLSKALYFFQYYDMYSGVFSFEIKNRISSINKQVIENS